MGGAELFLSRILVAVLPRSMAASTHHAVVAIVTIVVFAGAGLWSGSLARRRDVVPLMVIAPVAMLLILLAVGIAAVEAGAVEARRNVVVGSVCLAALTGAYFAGQRLGSSKSS
jgi:cytochrome bd-type quinol oxidase subunit 1